MSSAAVRFSHGSSAIQRSMDLFNGLPENGTDHLQREIADQLTRDKEPVDELHLAALLGKTLLEKNGELEQKLRKLQDFAEETLATNQTLVRQLAESKDSLQFSNQLCEQLEMKVEELESTNQSLTKLCEGRRTMLAQKASDMTQMEEELSDVKNRFDGVREDLNRLRRDSAAGTTLGGGENGVNSLNGRSRRALSCHGGTNGTDGGEEEGEISSEEVGKLRESVAELSQKLNNSNFQKSRLERELQGAISENTALSKSLERVEADLGELQVRYDEMVADNFTSNCTTPLSPSSSLAAVRNNITAPSQMESIKGRSLFSELGTEFSSLQQSVQELSRNTSDASGLIASASQHGGMARESETTPTVQLKIQQEGVAKTEKATPTIELKIQSQSSGGSFKDLFDEMFATLRQTAKVADRLIERRGQ